VRVFSLNNYLLTSFLQWEIIHSQLKNWNAKIILNFCEIYLIIAYLLLFVELYLKGEKDEDPNSGLDFWRSFTGTFDVINGKSCLFSEDK
jgi:hypothetical protein